MLMTPFAANAARGPAFSTNAVTFAAVFFCIANLAMTSTQFKVSSTDADDDDVDVVAVLCFFIDAITIAESRRSFSLDLGVHVCCNL